MWTRCLMCVAVLAAVGCDDGGGGGAPDDAAAPDARAADAADRDARGVEDVGPSLDVAVGPDAASDGGPDGAPDAEADVDLFPPDRAPLFAAGCPRPGRASVGLIESPEFRMEGPDAVGGPGDYLLMNTQAAFVVTGGGPVKTYYYYPGVLVDAVPLDGCRQVAPERFDEIGWLVGRLDPTDFGSSILRAVRGTAFEVISDGSDGGEARLRVRAVDDIQWLVELELVKLAFRGGQRRALSESMGLEISVDYVLPPDSRVLRIEVTLTNTLGASQRVLDAGMTIFGDSAPTTFFHNLSIDVSGFSVRAGLPWIVSRSLDGAWAVARADANLGVAHIAGVDALLDVSTAVSPRPLAAAGREGDSRTTTWYFAVSDGDVNRAVAPLHALNSGRIGGQPYMLGALEGRVVDTESGEGIGGAMVTVEMRGRGEEWAPIDELRADASGAFSGLVPDLGGPLRLRPSATGREPTVEPPVELLLGDPAPVALAMSPPGALVITVRDEETRPLPAKVDLYRDGHRLHWFYTHGADRRFPVPPGEYELSVSRGFEHQIHRAPITVPARGEVPVEVSLPRLLDTTGFLTTDAHMHAGPSPDSKVAVAERIEGAAAAGLQVAIGTDHEVVRDWNEGVRDTGLEAWIVATGGQEVTASLPEHVNAYPMAPLPMEEDFRGGPVPWYGLDIGQLYAAIRERGAGVVQLNHPRFNCSYLCLIGYDRLTGQATLDDPTALGFYPEAELWSWDFDAMELLNGLRSPFLRLDDPDRSGLFEDWQSFLNLGHRVTATGVTDVHGHNMGNPRMYIGFSGDGVGAFRPEHLTEAIHGGKAIVSAGAFARVEAVGVDGARGTLGDTVIADEGAITLRVRVEALPEIDVTRVLVFANCDLVATVAATDPESVVKFDGEIPLELVADAHLTVLAFGDRRMPRELIDYDPRGTPRLITNAIYIDADGDGVWTPPGGKTCTYDLGGP